MFNFNYILFLLIALASCSKATATKETPQQNEPNENNSSLFLTNVPKREYDIILTKPTGTAITLSVLPYQSGELYVEYFQSGSSIKTKTNLLTVVQNETKEILIENLNSYKDYTYNLYFKKSLSNLFVKSVDYKFKTALCENRPFTFAITADSHLDQLTDTSVYKTTLQNILSDSPDLLVDLGDTFMTDKYGSLYKSAIYNYYAQRYYFGLICHSVPLFFVQGNHDGEAGAYNDNTSDNMAIWSNQIRKKYFQNPLPNNFYTGNITSDPLVGLVQNYFSWEWGNSLFIVLDPFWYTPLSGTKDPWSRTLGKIQYDWLVNTLQNSRAVNKFVFIHNLVGGFDLDGKGRGGAEAADYYEWGGKSLSGDFEFASKRSGWSMPIHQLFVKYKVNVVFHGHDHLFAHQTRDGVVYQCLPQPGAYENANANQAKSYGYLQGDILGGAGYLRVTVGLATTSISYVSTSVKQPSNNKKVVFLYNL